MSRPIPVNREAATLTVPNGLYFGAGVTTRALGISREHLLALRDRGVLVEGEGYQLKGRICSWDIARVGNALKYNRKLSNSGKFEIVIPNGLYFGTYAVSSLLGVGRHCLYQLRSQGYLLEGEHFRYVGSRSCNWNLAGVYNVLKTPSHERIDYKQSA